MYNKIELFHVEPEDTSREFMRYSEMSDFDRDFLCGMLKQKRPHKIVEIGVSAGATTAIILSCLKTLDISCEMYSVDLNEKWYRDRACETGFAVKNHMTHDFSVNHRFMLGRPIPYVLDEIGKEIDFLILDSMHFLPGEVLDFLVCLPYLKEKAVVILHDIELDLRTNGYPMANKGLFCTVTAKKWYMENDNSYYFGLANIAAFEVGAETRENIADVFMLLNVAWRYLIPEKDLEKYNQIIERFYDEDLTGWIRKIENAQISAYDYDSEVETHARLDGEFLREKWREQKTVILYGTGYWGNRYLEYARRNHLPVSCFVISDGEKKTADYIDGIPVYFFSELPVELHSGILIKAMDENNQKNTAEKLRQAEWKHLIAAVPFFHKKVFSDVTDKAEETVK